MKKTEHSILAVLLLAGLAVLLTAEGAKAFCVYNKTDRSFLFQQTAGHKTFHGFYVKIPPGESACCNWRNRDCNKEGKEHSIVRFDVFYKGLDMGPMYACKDFAIHAAGALTVEGSNYNYKCVRHDYAPPPPLPIGPLP